VAPKPDSFLTTSSRPKFIADEMVGRLAKWLRLLGYDTVYANKLTDTEMLDIAESERRIIVTRDRLLIRRRRCRNHIFIQSDHWRQQLKQVYVEAGLDCERMLSMCPLCNRALNPVDRHSVESLVPAYVYRTQETFLKCGQCSRIFWSATHVSEIHKELESLKEES